MSPHYCEPTFGLRYNPSPSILEDLWIFTSANRQPGVSLPVDLPMGMGPDGGDTAVAEKARNEIEQRNGYWFAVGAGLLQQIEMVGAPSFFESLEVLTKFRPS